MCDDVPVGEIPFISPADIKAIMAARWQEIMSLRLVNYPSEIGEL